MWAEILNITICWKETNMDRGYFKVFYFWSKKKHTYTLYRPFKALNPLFKSKNRFLF